MAKIAVAPLVGAWIEIKPYLDALWKTAVAPLVGAWIEIAIRQRNTAEEEQSLPSWERGLKFKWKKPAVCHKGRSPRGSVD